MADVNHGHGRHRRNPPKQAKFHVIVPFAVIALVIGGSIVARGNNVPAANPMPTIVETVIPTPAPSPTSTPKQILAFASWNIAKPANDVVPAWKFRREAIGRSITSSGADVIALQEANEVQVRGEGGKRMTTWKDVQLLAKKSGYIALKIQKDACSKECVHTARILINSKTVRQVKLKNKVPSAGHGILSEVASGIGKNSKRQFSWAFLESVEFGEPFLVISIHTDNSKSKKGVLQRAKIGREFTAWVKEQIKVAGLSDAPAFLMGDYNSSIKREPKGMVFQLEKAGWIDVYNSSESLIGLSKKANTSSYSNSQHGWPKKPILSSNPNRIDHIMYLGKNINSKTYMVALHLKDNGSFDNNYRASDHLLIKSIIEFEGTSN